MDKIDEWGVADTRYRVSNGIAVCMYARKTMPAVSRTAILFFSSAKAK